MDSGTANDAAERSLAGLRIGLLTASASRRGGGVFEAVVAQAALIEAAGGEARVFALHDDCAALDLGRFAPGSVSHARVVGPAVIGFAPALVGLLEAARLDCLHLHGIWMYPSSAASRWSARSGRPVVISPHGMLAPWIVARGRTKKWVARLAYERTGWRRARALHALTLAEAQDIARHTRREAIVIPNGAPACTAAQEPWPSPTLVYIGRIHPKKNLGALIAGWSQALAALPPGARLVIAGWGDPAHVTELERAIAAAPPSVTFVGAVHGEAKRALLAQARFVALPSHSEGLPMAILEAWAAGVPTLMSAACNLDTGFAAGAALDSGTQADTIAAVIAQALHLPEPRWRAMAQAAGVLADGPFAASTVADQWIRTYRALMTGGARGATLDMA